MRAAIITETFPPEINGVALTVSKIVEGLLDRHHEIEIIRPKQHKGDIPSVSGHLEQVTVPGLPLPKYNGLKFGLPARRKLLNRWRYRRPDIVHIATEGPLGLTALWAAKRLEIPISSTFHTNFQTYTKHYGYAFLHQAAIKYLRYFHNATQATIVPSYDMRNILAKEHFLNLHVVGRGVDTNLFNPEQRNDHLRKSWGAADNEIVFICVSRIAEEKNIPVVIQTFQQISQVNLNAKLVLVGDGPARKTLQKRYPNVIFVGMKRDQELAQHYASADVFLFASNTETFGNVITEALASGLAVVAYNYAATSMHITHNHNGLAPELDNTEQFTSESFRLASNPELIQTLRQNAAKYALQLSWSSIVNQIENIFNSVIATETKSQAKHISPKHRPLPDDPQSCIKPIK
ncbi:GDP-mannose-dependent alpha-mannosyltransferase [Poriferisphaera corsica]|uniref:GDP-mannose-dependent alpha-mannosyltransferase n=1 Tax=Poriferisphaera corsica TaxID=2528020 RepID=A0A517YUD6_9BACT|nr:glycosyltransferase family 1 protein [Poriferisphaera corsica]QDU33839.1 GDP-mannose-dependent alpha-mannosyltransferase [Poriferisphaera corsica]